jgi:peptide/nickel transport system substrate-binding protein
MGAQEASMGSEQSTLSVVLDRRLSRRSALKVIGGGTVAAIAVACAPTSSSPSVAPGPSGTVAPTSSPAATAAPTTASNVIEGTINGQLLPTLPRGGNIALEMSNPGSLSPWTDTAFSAAEAVAPCHDWLEAFDYQRELRPSLAERLEIVDDTTLKYTLHEGATFHDGRPVTAAVVKELVEWVKNPDNESYLADPLADVTIEAPDERTVIVQLSKPHAGIRRTLSLLPIVPADSIAGQATKPMGCGPFLFEEWVRDSHISFRANPNYRNPDAPRLDTLRHSHFGDPVAGAQAFLAGETDFEYVVPAGLVEEFKARGEAGELKWYVGEQGFVYLGFNLRKAPYDDPRVRKALRLAVDRAPLADAPFAGLGRQLPIPMRPEFPYYPAGIEAELLVRDLDQARQLLAEAGFPTGFTDKLIVVRQGFPESMAVILQSQFAEIGLNVEIEALDQPTLLERRNSGDFTMLILGNLLDPEPTAYLARHFRTDGTWANRYGYSNPECDKNLDAAAATFDNDDRRDLYERALRVALIDDTSMISLTPEAFMYAYKPWTNGDQFGPTQFWKMEVASRTT